nr:MAG TPA: hypothetical protein [Caudoviricetes sp.]
MRLATEVKQKRGKLRFLWNKGSKSGQVRQIPTVR